MNWFQPGRFSATGATVKYLIALAYKVKDFQISGGLGWINSEKYDIEAKVEDSEVQELTKLPSDKQVDQICLRVQSLLADRFGLKVSQGTRELLVYALVVAQNGPKLSPTTYVLSPPYHPGSQGPGMRSMGRGSLSAQAVTMSNLADALSRQFSRVVLDHTGLIGKYDFTLQWTPDENATAMFKVPSGGNPGTNRASPPDTSGPSLFTALQEQLGLMLEATKVPVEVIVIDHIERPSEN